MRQFVLNSFLDIGVFIDINIIKAINLRNQFQQRVTCLYIWNISIYSLQWNNASPIRITSRHMLVLADHHDPPLCQNSVSKFPIALAPASLGLKYGWMFSDSLPQESLPVIFTVALISFQKSIHPPCSIMLSYILHSCHHL